MTWKLNEENVSRRMWGTFGSNVADIPSGMRADNSSLDLVTWKSLLTIIRLLFVEGNKYLIGVGSKRERDLKTRIRANSCHEKQRCRMATGTGRNIMKCLLVLRC